MDRLLLFEHKISEFKKRLVNSYKITLRVFNTGTLVTGRLSKRSPRRNMWKFETHFLFNVFQINSYIFSFHHYFWNHLLLSNLSKLKPNLSSFELLNIQFTPFLLWSLVLQLNSIFRFEKNLIIGDNHTCLILYYLLAPT